MSEDTPVIILFKSAHPALYTAHRRYPGSQLGPGFLAAHRMTHLVLLHSCPDTVHEVLLRKTQTSTPLTRGSPASSHPRRDITSAGADCRYRAPLSPRLRGNFMTNLCLSSIPVGQSFVKFQFTLEFPYFYPHSPAFTGSAINNFQKMPKHKESYSFLM